MSDLLKIVVPANNIIEIERKTKEPCDIEIVGLNNACIIHLQYSRKTRTMD